MAEMSRKEAIEFLKKTEISLQNLRSSGLSITSAEELHSKVNEAVMANKKSESIALINELNTKLENLKKNLPEFLNNLTTCQNNLKLAKDMDLDISQLEEEIAEATQLFQDENFNEANSNMKQCNQQLIDNMFLFITEEVKSVYHQLKELPKNIVSSRDIQQLFNDADSAIKSNDFSLAWSITKQLKEISMKYIGPYLNKYQELAKDKIIEFQNEIESAKKQGADLSDAQEVFSEIIERMRKAKLISEIKEIIDYTSAGKSALARAIRRKERMDSQSKGVKDDLEEVISHLEKLKTNCAIPSSVEKLVKSAKDEFAIGNFENVRENVKTCNLKMEKLRAASEPKIELKFQGGDLKADLWNRVKLIVANKGLASADNIDIKFSGPLEVRRMPILDTLNYNDAKTIEIGLKPEGAGNLPIDVDLNFTRSLDSKTYHEHQEVWLDVKLVTQLAKPVPTPVAGTPVTSAQPPGDVISCLSCHRAIEKSAPIFKCNCGTIYHLDCITNLDICLNCNKPIKHQVSMPAPIRVHTDSLDDVDWE